MTNTKKIIETIENCVLNSCPIIATKEKVVLIHDDASGYVFKTNFNQWKTASFEHVNNISKLGAVNCSLLD